MTKKIAVINDLSGFGRCSLTAAISTIAVMGVQPCPLPTAVLSAQTGYPSWYCDDYTEKMEYFRQEWEKMQVRFDGIYTGFVASEAQIRHIFRFLDTFYKEPAFLLVDPVMGDEGKVYKMFTPELLRQMKELAMRADVITPNLTELCLLTGVDFSEIRKRKGKKELLAAVEELAARLVRSGPGTVIVTGIRFEEEESGECANVDSKVDMSGECVNVNPGADGNGKSMSGSPGADVSGKSMSGSPGVDVSGKSMVGNLAVNENGGKLSAFPYIGGSFSGTGDLFASVIAGGIARGDDIFRTMDLAGEFIEKAMKDSMAGQVERNDGTNYEKYLGMLISGR